MDLQAAAVTTCYLGLYWGCEAIADTSINRHID